jgi:3-hydroxybutyryl-CoA dehydrogenase
MNPILNTHSLIGVIGAGSMGSGIAQVAAQAGHDVVLFDVAPEAATRGRERIAQDLGVAVQKGRLNAEQRDAALSRVHTARSLDDLREAQVVIEAIAEKLDVKQSVFKQVEALVSPQAILVSNTSSISITAIAQALNHPARFAGLHFFNPATRMKLVEVIAGVETSPAVIDQLHQLARAWGKTTVDAPNAPGFIVNRVARPYYAEGLRLLAEGVASASVIDGLLRQAGGFAMGPFELMDLIGVEVNLSVTQSVFEATAYDGRFAPHLIQQELARSGRFGRKSGQGFHAYNQGENGTALPLVTPAASAPTLRHGPDAGPLSALLARLREAGVALTQDNALPSAQLAMGDVRLALSDGRTAAQLAHEGGLAHILIDLSHDWARTPVLGCTASRGARQALPELATLLKQAGIGLVELDDVAGLVVMRTVCCLANEAADMLSWTRTAAADIDTAMKLGTAYPKGPLAWADELGATLVHTTLRHLQAHYGDARYRQAPRLSRAHHEGAAFHG